MREYIEAREGFILTNGDVYGKRIYLAKGIEASAFTEITEAAYDAVLQNESKALES